MMSRRFRPSVAKLALERHVLGIAVGIALLDLVGCGKSSTVGAGTGVSGAGGSSGASGATDEPNAGSGVGGSDAGSGAGASGGSGASAGSGASGGSGASAGSGASSGSGALGGSDASGGSGASGGAGAGTGGAVQGVGAASSVEEVCASYPAAWGAYMARCHGGDAEEWQRTIQIPCASAIEAESQGRIRLDTENAAICLNGLAQQDCTGSTPPACSYLVTGTVPAGEICKRLGLWGDTGECENGFCTSEVVDSCTSSCTPYLQLGENCTGQFNYTPCAPGTQCSPDLGCTVGAGEGEDCSGTWDCKSSFYCEISEGSDSGTCERPKTEGACTTAAECAPGLSCVGDAGEKSCLPIKPVGAPCTFGWYECGGQCSLDGQCEIAADEGEPCGTLTDPVTERTANLKCDGGLYCDLDAQTCRPRIEPGKPCSGSVNTCGDPAGRVTTCEGGLCAICE